MSGPTEEGEGDQVTITKGAILAEDDDSVTVYGVGMSDDDALALVIAYAKAATHVQGMTRQ